MCYKKSAYLIEFILKIARIANPLQDLSEMLTVQEQLNFSGIAMHAMEPSDNL